MENKGYHVDSSALFARLVDENGRKRNLRQIAEATGMSRAALSRLLRGGSPRCSISTAACLSRHFGKDVIIKK